MASHYVQNETSSVPGRGGPTASSPQLPFSCPHLLHSQHKWHAKLGPTSGSLQHRCPPPESSLLRYLFGQLFLVCITVTSNERNSSLIIQRKQSVSLYLTHSLHSGVCVSVLGRRLFILQFFICLHTVLQKLESQLPALATGWSQRPFSTS